jgi:hypothetical protein
MTTTSAGRRPAQSERGLTRFFVGVDEPRQGTARVPARSPLEALIPLTVCAFEVSTGGSGQDGVGPVLRIVVARV